LAVSTRRRQISRTQNGGTKTLNYSAFQKFISSKLSDVETFTEFNGEITFKSDQNKNKLKHETVEQDKPDFVSNWQR